MPPLIDVRNFFDFDAALHRRADGSYSLEVPVDLLPQLRLAIERAEKEAVREGRLTAADYRKAGIAPPLQLLP